MTKTTLQIKMFEEKNNAHLPDGWYGLGTRVCSNPACHCNNIIVTLVYGAYSNKDPQGIDSLKEIATLTVKWEGSKISIFLSDQCDENSLTDKAIAFVKDKISHDKNLLKEWKEIYLSAKPSFTNNNVLMKAEPKNKRNDPCSCGSGKKYKKCCMLKLVES